MKICLDRIEPPFSERTTNDMLPTPGVTKIQSKHFLRVTAKLQVTCFRR